MISHSVRDFLILHIDGPVSINPAIDLRARAGALALGLVVRDQAGPRTRHRRRDIKPTMLTEKGREVLAAALGNWADAIVRVNLMKEALAFNLASQLLEDKAQKAPEPAIP